MMRGRSLSREEIRARIESLGPWFHNIELAGMATAPTHFLGDYPQVKWRQFSHALAPDLSGASVLDIGCNAGFYALEMKRRGARRVLGIDFDKDYLDQARFAAEVSGLEVEFRELSVYDVAELKERFDIVLFMGVFYHLRHPLLALDLIRAHVARDLFVFQSMQRGSGEVEPVAEDYAFFEFGALRCAGLSQAAFPRAQLRRRSDQLVGAQPRLRRGAAQGERLCHSRPSRGRGLYLPGGADPAGRPHPAS